MEAQLLRPYLDTASTSFDLNPTGSYPQLPRACMGACAEGSTPGALLNFSPFEQS